MNVDNTKEGKHKKTVAGLGSLPLATVLPPLQNRSIMKKSQSGAYAAESSYVVQRRSPERDMIPSLTRV